jgi:hypothetical protein
MGDTRNTYRILAGKPEWKRLITYRRRWENTIVMDNEIVLEGTD